VLTVFTRQLPEWWQILWVLSQDLFIWCD